MGARFDAKVANCNVKEADRSAKVALSKDNEAGLLSAMAYGKDVTTPDADEASAHLKVGGDYYSIGGLLGSGSVGLADRDVAIIDKVKSGLTGFRSEADLALGIPDEPSQSAALRSGDHSRPW